MIIDKNGKLFGKISVIDIIIVIFLIIAVGFVAVKYVFKNNPITMSGANLDKLEITFSSEEVNDFVVDAMSIGDSVKELAQYASFGTVTDIIVSPSITWVSDHNGIVHSATKEDKYKAVTVKTVAYGTIDQTGFSLDGTSYFVGKTVVMYIGKAGFQGRISSVEKVD